MHVDEPAVTEVVVAPHLVEQALPAEHPAGVLGELAQQPELGLGEVQLGPGAQHLALVGDDLEIAEHQPGVRRADRADAPQQGPDASGELLRRERLGEVVVGACLETGDDVVGVVAGGDHDDRYVTVTAQGAAQLEAVDARAA